MMNPAQTLVVITLPKHLYHYRNFFNVYGLYKTNLPNRYIGDIGQLITSQYYNMLEGRLQFLSNGVYNERKVLYYTILCEIYKKFLRYTSWCILLTAVRILSNSDEREKTMRRHYTKILKSFFHNKFFYARASLGVTQEEMAHRLAMAARTYVDLDHGKTSCSALTLALFLIYVSTDPVAFLEELRDAFEAYDNKAA